MKTTRLPFIVLKTPEFSMFSIRNEMQKICRGAVKVNNGITVSDTNVIQHRKNYLTKNGAMNLTTQT